MLDHADVVAKLLCIDVSESFRMSLLVILLNSNQVQRQGASQ